MSHLSIAARILLARNDLISLDKCAQELRQALEQARAFRRNEYFIASLALVSLAIDSPDAARRIVSDFSESRSNDRLAPWRELALFR
jgi:hypothetical protein